MREFASRHNATISTVWGQLQKLDSNRSDSFLVRRMLWSEGSFGKAVMIAQHYDLKGADTAFWDFIILAWTESRDKAANPSYENVLLKRVAFPVIEKNIDRLLKRTEMD